MISMFVPKTLEELKEIIQRTWDSITPEICNKIINHVEKRWDLCIKHKGRRLDKELLKKIASENSKTRIKLLKAKINGIRISYNDKFVDILKNKDIREKTRKIKEQIKKENNFKNKFERMMKLKPKDYRDIPDNEKKELKFHYDYEKAKRELIHEKLEEIKKMTSIEYLNILNDKIKEKLIGLSLNKKILDAYEDDLFSNNDDLDTKGIEGAEEEEEEDEEENK